LLVPLVRNEAAPEPEQHGHYRRKSDECPRDEDEGSAFKG
jgi:hypothetical protein